MPVKTTQDLLILVADEVAEDCMLLQEVFEENRLKNTLHFVQNGEELMHYLHQATTSTNPTQYPIPGLILLDWNLPGESSRVVLQEIKSNLRLNSIPVVIFTTSKVEEDILKNLNVDSYIRKPVTFASLVDMVIDYTEFWFQLIHLPDGPTDT